MGFLARLALAGCGDGDAGAAGGDAGGAEGADAGGGEADATMSNPPGPGRTLGAVVLSSGAVRFRLASVRATRVELSLYATALGAPAALTRVLQPLAGSDYFEVVVEPTELQAAGVTGTIYYGYRVWGPNWPWDASWQPGSLAGWSRIWHHATVDARTGFSMGRVLC